MLPLLDGFACALYVRVAPLFLFFEVLFIVRPFLLALAVPPPSVAPFSADRPAFWCLPLILFPLADARVRQFKDMSLTRAWEQTPWTSPSAPAMLLAPAPEGEPDLLPPTDTMVNII